MEVIPTSSLQLPAPESPRESLREHETASHIEPPSRWGTHAQEALGLPALRRLFKHAFVIECQDAAGAPDATKRDKSASRASVGDPQRNPVEPPWG